MFKTFSLFAIIAIASADETKTEETKPKMVAMTAAEITEACNANMATLCTELGGMDPAGKLQEDPENEDDPDLCAEAQKETLGELCTQAGKSISAGVATDATEAAKDEMKDLLTDVTASIAASGAKTTEVGTWTTGMKEVKEETTDTDADKKDAEGDDGEYAED